MVERAPKPGGGAPARRAKRRSPTAQRARGRTPAGAWPERPRARSVACVTSGARMARDGRVLSRTLGQVGRLRAARAAVDDGDERDDRVAGWWRGSATAT